MFHTWRDMRSNIHWRTRIWQTTDGVTISQCPEGSCPAIEPSGYNAGFRPGLDCWDWAGLLDEATAKLYQLRSKQEFELHASEDGVWTRLGTAHFNPVLVCALMANNKKNIYISASETHLDVFPLYYTNYYSYWTHFREFHWMGWEHCDSLIRSVTSKKNVHETS